ncbi:MAG: MipA/OmpV family protein [Gammaproteobacteria bacterium]
MKLLVALIVAAHAASAAGAELPLWEVGFGPFPSTYPTYRGSRDRQNYLLPFPYLLYRGDILRIDREGIRAQLFDSEGIHVNISANGSIPAESNSHSARQGMPDLDATFEIGPSLDILVSEPSPRQSVKIRLPVRAVIATDFRHAGGEGWLFNPQFNWHREGGTAGWDAGVSLGPLFATRKYHAYYYEVAPEFSTAARPEYRASAGYSGTALAGSMSRRFEKFWVGGFVRYDFLGGAAFDDSPLVQTEHSLMGGVAVAWVFATSKQTVSR